jgi:hypothetical protein
MKLTTDAYPFPLGSKPTWQEVESVAAVQLSNGMSFHLIERDGKLEVNTYGGRLTVRPGASNAVYLTVEEEG